MYSLTNQEQSFVGWFFIVTHEFRNATRGYLVRFLVHLF